MISGWMENGTINQFIKKHPDVDRLGLVSLSIFTPPGFTKIEGLLVGGRNKGADLPSRCWDDSWRP